MTMEKVDFEKDRVTSEEELRELIGTPNEFVANKTISFMDENCKRFIAASPLMFLATSDAEGKCDVSPRGDSPGSMLILNDHQLIIPDRPGNKRLDSILNILSNPRAGLIFLIPGMDEVLRINGKASIIKNEEILSQMSLKGRAPVIGIGIDVEECFIHCPRALQKSTIWKPDEWPDKTEVPAMMEIYKGHLAINGLKR